MAFDPVSAGLAAVSIGSSLLGGNAAEKAAEKAYKAQAKLTKGQRLEEIYQREKAARKEAGAARAAVGASNIQFSGSAKQYMEELDYANMRELAVARQAMQNEQKAILAGASGAGGPLFAQAAGDAIGYAAKALIQGFRPSQAKAPTSSQLAANDWNDFSGGSAWDESF